MRLPSFFVAAACTVTLALPATAKVEPELTREDFFLYCGFLDAQEMPKYAKIKSKKKQLAKIARYARVKAKTMKKAVEKGSEVGATCDEVGKLYEADAKKALKGEKSLAGRILWDTYLFDFSTPDHVVVAVSWTGADKKKLVQEASLIAKVLADAAPIAKTIAIRGVNPRAADKTSDEAIWWEAKTSPDRASRIDVKRIPDFADRRYIRLFDGVVDKVAKQ
jgi:hypothetical protein